MSAICRLVFPLCFSLCCSSDCNVWRRTTWMYLCVFIRFFFFLNVRPVFARSSMCEVCYESACRCETRHALRWSTASLRAPLQLVLCSSVCPSLCAVSHGACVLVQLLLSVWTHFSKRDVCFSKFVCPSAPPYVCVFIIQGHSIAPHGSIPYPGHHGYRGHLSQRVPADQTGVHPDDVSPRRLLLGTFVAHNAQVLVDTENQQEGKTLSWCPSLSWCVCVCVLVHVGLVRNSVRFSPSKWGCLLLKRGHFVGHRFIKLRLH